VESRLSLWSTSAVCTGASAPATPATVDSVDITTRARTWTRAPCAGTADRDRVNLFHAPTPTKPFAAPTKPFSCLGEDVLKLRSDLLTINAIKQRGSMMFAFILNSIYREILRTSLSGMHKFPANWRLAPIVDCRA
jgi:hypothetical protein